LPPQLAIKATFTIVVTVSSDSFPLANRFAQLVAAQVDT
jgi:hypothetical protein